MANNEYYCVHVYNPHTFGQTTSPKYETIGECRNWIQDHIFDSGVDVEIRKVSVIPVSYSELEVTNSIIGKCSDLGLGIFATDTASKIFWDNGCIDKGYFVRNPSV